MRKIPTLFQRTEDRRYVTDQVTPGCEWVLAGEGRATRKYDGTCILIRRDGLALHAFARREVKPGKEPPANWVEVDHDDVTGKRVGWEPVEQSGFARWFDEAAQGFEPPGTYELCGPKINGNPEHFRNHCLIPHGERVLLSERWLNGPISAGDLYRRFPGVVSAAAGRLAIEGIVWWHPDGRKAKLKRRDFPR